MVRKGFVAFALFIFLAGTGKPKDAKEVVNDVAKAIGAANVRSVQYSGSGYIFPFGQNYRPTDPWPKFNLKSYNQLVDYEKGAWREEDARSYMDPPEVGGSALFWQELRQVSFLSGESAWNLGPNGAPAPAPAEVDARQVELALTPHGWVKSAMASNPSMKAGTLNGKPVTVVSFTLKGKYKVNGYVDSQSLLQKTETWLPDPVLGDMLVETAYSDYRDFAGVKFPMKIVEKRGGFPVLELTVNEVQPNAPANITVPEPVRGAVAPPARAESQKVADGVWFLSGASHNSAAVEFSDYVAVIDAPLNEERSLAVIAEVKRLVPNKPIRYLINTHHHFDHSGGLRTYVAEGATIITQEINKPFYEQTFQMPRTLIPDRLAQNPKPAKFITVKDKYVLTDGAHSIELYLMQDNPHNAGLLFAYLPKEKMLFQADSYTAPPAGAPLPPAVNVYNTRNSNLEDNIERLNLDVQQILSAHGKVISRAELRKAVGKAG